VYDDRPSHRERTQSGRAWLTRARAVRLIAAIAIGLVLGAGIFVAPAVQAEVGRRLVVGTYGLWWLIGGALAAILAPIVWVLWRRPRRRAILVGAAVLVAAGLTAGLLLRVDGFYGNVVPRLAWRWSPRAEEQLAAYLEKEQSAEAVELPPADLSPSGHDHPGFLGADRDGVARGVSLDPDWQARPPRELWRHPVGLGWGGFAVVGNCAVTQEQRGAEETIVCYDLRSGRERWQWGAPARFSNTYGDGPRATPTIAAGRVYTLGATGLVTCLDGATGRRIWHQDVFQGPGSGPSPSALVPRRGEASQAKGNLAWGMAGSPLVLGDYVIVTPGARPGRAVLALRCQDGALAWSGGDDPAAYASPVAVQLCGLRQILSFDGAGLRGYDAADGNPLWLHPWVTQGKQMINVAQPLVVAPFGAPASHEGFVVVSSGYGVGAALLRVAWEKGVWRVAEVWRNKLLRSKLSNFVVRDGALYGLDDGVLTCLDPQDGQRLWKQGRYGHGQLLLAGNTLIVQAESGEIVLVEATAAEHRELARLPVLHEKTWNHPALAGNVLVVRNDREAAAFELPLAK
jgi:outer membrane protein assembly factor BamB